MSTPTGRSAVSYVDEVEAEAKSIARSLEPRARRFLAGFFAALMATFLMTDPSQWSGNTLWSLLVGALVTAIGEASPSVPLQTLVNKIADIRGGPSKSAWRNGS